MANEKRLTKKDEIAYRREKLIELLDNSFAEQYEKRGLLTAPHTADHLIANGVTVQEWISVKDRLPEKFHSVLAARKIGDWFGIDIESIGATDKWSGDVFTDHEVTHWMPLPQPPKGE